MYIVSQRHCTLSRLISRDAPKATPISNALAPRNDFLGSGEWLSDIIWDSTKVAPDLFDDEEDQDSGPQKRITDISGIKIADSFNLSNDGLYEHSREARFRIRQTFGAIEVFHSQPAKTLQIPFVSDCVRCLVEADCHSTRLDSARQKQDHGDVQLSHSLSVYRLRCTSSRTTPRHRSAQRRGRFSPIQARDSRPPRISLCLKRAHVYFWSSRRSIPQS